MSFGNNVSINPYSYLAGNINIGSNVSIANHTSIHCANHSFSDKTVPIKYQPIINDPITIEDDVWIASGCRILSGVHIGKRVIIAAGAVVTKSIETNSIYAGVPAKKIKSI